MMATMLDTWHTVFLWCTTKPIIIRGKSLLLQIWCGNRRMADGHGRSAACAIHLTFYREGKCSLSLSGLFVVSQATELALAGWVVTDSRLWQPQRVRKECGQFGLREREGWRGFPGSESLGCCWSTVYTINNLNQP